VTWSDTSSKSARPAKDFESCETVSFAESAQCLLVRCPAQLLSRNQTSLYAKIDISSFRYTAMVITAGAQSETNVKCLDTTPLFFAAVCKPFAVAPFARQTSGVATSEFIKGEDQEAISLQDFLEMVHLRESRKISGLAETDHIGWVLASPDISLFCSDPSCNRIQNFRRSDPDVARLGERTQDFIIHYLCKNCERTVKTFALRQIRRTSYYGTLMKIGEFPAFGPPLPARLQRLVQAERGFLLKGFQSENRGLGIGAFAYYRRLVEDLKTELIDEIIKTCRKIPTAATYIPALEKAREEKQFARAVGDIGEAIPDALRIDGHNPLSLLHQALSRDLHSASDEECLEAASAIRVVLSELTERMAYITRESSELQTALSKLFGQRTTIDITLNSDK